MVENGAFNGAICAGLSAIHVSLSGWPATGRAATVDFLQCVGERFDKGFEGGGGRRTVRGAHEWVGLLLAYRFASVSYHRVPVFERVSDGRLLSREAHGSRYSVASGIDRYIDLHGSNELGAGFVMPSLTCAALLFRRRLFYLKRCAIVVPAGSEWP